MNSSETKRILYIGMFTLFFAVVMLQMSNIFYSHDDYGYLTLSYHNANISGFSGTKYGFIHILKFLYYHYMHIGSRVLYFFIETVLGKNIWLLRIVEALVITALAAFITKVNDKSRNYLTPLLIMSMFFGLSLIVTYDAIYWFSASVIYLFPLLPFFVGCDKFFRAVFEKKPSRQEHYAICALLFAAGFSQEQISCAAVFFVIAVIFIKWVTDKDKKYRPSFETLTEALSCAAGFCMLMLSPGAWQRAFLNETGLFERLYKHTKSVILDIYIGDGAVFQIIMLIIVFLASYYMLRKKKVNFIFASVNMIFTVILLLLCLKYWNGCYTSIVMELEDYDKATVVLICHFILTVALITVFCIKVLNDIKVPIFIAAGIISQVFMLISPSSVPYRTVFPLYYTLIFSLSAVADRLFIVPSAKKFNTALVIVLLIVSAANYAGTIDGFYSNRAVHKSNDVILRNAAEAITNGEEIKELTLYKVPDEIYAVHPEPYEAEYIQKYIKKYYELPQDIKFNYIDYYRNN